LLYQLSYVGLLLNHLSGNPPNYKIAAGLCLTPLPSTLYPLHFSHLFHKAKGPPGNRATLSSMGGSFNGGKAIETLWCKSMVGSHRCQERFLNIINPILINNLANFFRFLPAFPGFLPPPGT
jgi:hypothetical protein